MNPQDLRIGNKLQKDNGEIFTVLRLDNTMDVLVEEQRGLLTLNYNLFGIPLTEDVLVKCGGELVGLMDSTEMAWKIGMYIYTQSELKRMPGLHWLQNNYYFRTATELTVNI